jgi:ActR/RegA family two-component response regulator
MPSSRPAIRLLIVDDGTALRQTLARRFQKQGWTVTEAGSGEDAVKLAEQRRFEVVPPHRKASDRNQAKRGRV